MTDSPFRALIGRWEFEASSGGRFLGRGSTTFDWLEDGAFVLQRARDEPDPRTSADWSDHTPMPVTAVLGFDDSTGDLSMLYSDARGVFRIYRMTLTDHAWTVRRDAPGFNQRFIGRMEDAGRTIRGAWETSEDGSSWSVDFDMVYRRVTDEIRGEAASEPMSPITTDTTGEAR